MDIPEIGKRLAALRRFSVPLHWRATRKGRQHLEKFPDALPRSPIKLQRSASAPGRHVAATRPDRTSLPSERAETVFDQRAVISDAVARRALRSRRSGRSPRAPHRGRPLWLCWKNAYLTHPRLRASPNVAIFKGSSARGFRRTAIAVAHQSAWVGSRTSIFRGFGSGM